MLCRCETGNYFLPTIISKWRMFHLNNIFRNHTGAETKETIIFSNIPANWFLVPRRRFNAERGTIVFSSVRPSVRPSVRVPTFFNISLYSLYLRNPSTDSIRILLEQFYYCAWFCYFKSTTRIVHRFLNKKTFSLQSIIFV